MVKSFVSTQNFNVAVDEGQGRLNPSRGKNEGMHRRRKVGQKIKDQEKKARVFITSCVTTVGSSWTEKKH